MRARYQIQWPGKDGWSKWTPLGAKLSTDRCCDCKLVHENQYRVRKDGWIEMRSRRSNRKTAASRRAFGISIKTRKP